MSWFVYITKSRFGHYYSGITNGVEKRIEAHNLGRGSQMAKQQGPFELVYKSNPFLSKSEARKREAQIKKWRREKKERLISGKWS
ncbi:MAG: GIY-YIG nuclease family protein [bacterium]